MSRRKNNARQLRDEMLQYCGEIHEEDGIDPREWFKKSRSSNQQNRKIWQLCRQVARTLEFVLTDCDDSLVQSMDVITVVPNPDGSCLRVHVSCNEPSSVNEAIQALQRQASRLQFEIARSIHRKKVPNLTFTVGFPEGGIDEE